MVWYLGILLLLWPLLGMGLNNGQVFILAPFPLCVSFFPKTFFHVTNDGLVYVFTCESLLYRLVYRYMWEVLVGASLFEFLPLKVTSTLFRTIHLCERWHFCIAYQQVFIPGLS